MTAEGCRSQKPGAWEAVPPVHSAPADPPGGILRAIQTDSIRAGPYQPRQDFDGDDLEALAASVREHGVLQPVLVRPVDGAYELIAGERRWRAALLAGLTAVPAIVREMSDREAALISLVENVQRSDLHFLDEAAGYRRLIEEFGMTQAAVAARIGRTDSAVSHKLRLLELDESVRQKVVEWGLTERHARLLLRFPGPDEQISAARAFAGNSMSVRQAESWVANRLESAVPVEHEAGAPSGLMGAAERWAAQWRRRGYEATVEAGTGDVVEVRIRLSPGAQLRDRGLV